MKASGASVELEVKVLLVGVGPRTEACPCPDRGVLAPALPGLGIFPGVPQGPGLVRSHRIVHAVEAFRPTEWRHKLLLRCAISHYISCVVGQISVYGMH